MDWLTFKFCVLISVFVSKSRSQTVLNSTSSLSRSNQSQSACEEGQPVPSPDQCNSCICFAGLVYCSNFSCAEQECVNDEEIPPPDPCNKCICRRGKVTCTKMICIPAPNCAEKRLYPSQNECNACMCLNGFITCTSNVCTEENLPNVTTAITTTTKTPQKSKKCIEGSRLPGPNKCVECKCENGKKKCTNTCTTSVRLKSRFADTPKNECISGQSIPKPDECNNCICFEGEVHCTHFPCHTDVRIGQECSDDQPVFRPDECNECYCFEGKLQCSNVVCIRGSKCVQGEVIPKPDNCNACKCIEGHILCTNYQCPELDIRNSFTPEMSPTDVKPDECQDGDVIPPLPPPYECNTCFCVEKRILCTMNSCVDSDPEIKGRLKEENEQNHLQMFDKQISVEPFIDILYKNNDKLPTKVIHTHAYNGFHQEIKVHANHLPKDATGLLKALATTLDNSALASISQKLLTSSDSLSNNHEVVQNNLLGEGNMFTTQSSKLITSGSQSNETILVIPGTESFDSEYPQSVLPIANKHETFWKTVSAPAPTVYYDNQLLQPRNSQEENQNIYLNDRPPIIPSVQHSDMIRNPSKFTRPGLPRTFPTKPKPDTLELSNINTQVNPMLSPKPISVNSGKMNYAPLYQENNQFKPVPSGFGTRPPAQTPIFNYTLPSPVFGPGKLIATPNVNGGQLNPSQSQFAPNPTKYYYNQVKPQELHFKPNQNRPRHIFISNSNNKGIQYQPLFPNTPNQPIVSANQYKTPQFGLKPGQGNLFNNIGNQTDQKLKQYPPNFQIPPGINLPDQNKRISGFEIQTSKEKPMNSKFGPNPPQNGVNLEHTQHKPIHSQYIPNPSIYYKHEYQAPKINEINPDEDQLLPQSKLPFTVTEPQNQPHTYSEPDHEIIMPKVHNKTKKYNTTHSHYEKHTSITYVSETDPNDPVKPKIVGHEPNQDHNVPHSNEFDHYLPDQESQELDLTIPKVISLDPKEPYPKSNNYNPSQTSFVPSTSDINKYNPHSLGDPKNTDQIQLNQNRTYIPVNPYISANYTHTPSESQFMPLVDNAQKESLNDPDTFQSPTNSVEYPAHQKSPPSQTGPIQNQPPRFQYAHNANQEPLQQKPVNEFPTSEFETPQNNNLPGMLDERGSADGFQYPSHSIEDPTHSNPNNSTNFDPDLSHYDPAHPKDNLYITPQSQLAPTQNQHKPGMIDNHEIKDGYQYAHNANQNPKHLKPLYELSDFLFSPTLNQQKPEALDERGLSDGFQYPSNSDENPIHSRGNLNNPQKPQLSPNHIQYPLKSAEDLKEKTQMPLNSLFGPTQTQGVIDDRGSAGGFQYPSNSAEKSMHPPDHLHNSLYPKENPHYRPSLPLFDSSQNKNSPNLHYPTNSTKNIQQPNSLYGPIQNQHLPGMFDEGGSPDGFQYPSHSAENPLHKKQPSSPHGPTQNQHSPGIPGDRGSAGGFQYPSHSAENPLHQKQLNFPYGPTQHQHLPGIPDDRGSAGGFQYPSHSAENPSHQKQPNSPYGPTQNHYSPGIPDNRGSSGGFQYPSHSAENPLHQKQPNIPYGPIQNQHSPGIRDDRGSAGGFQYPSHSAENPSHQKQSNSPYGLTQNQYLPGIPDDRGSAGGFQYPSHSAENPSHKKQPNSPYGPTQNKHSPGIPNDRGPTGSFQYPSHSADNPLHQKQPNSPYGPIQHQHSPGILDDRGSAGSFQYPSHSVDNPLHKKQLNSPYGPTQNQHSPGISDDRGSAGGFQYPSHSVENPSHQKQPNSPYGPTQNQHSPGVLDERGSADGFQYPSHSTDDTTHPKDKLTHSPHFPILTKHLLEIFGERGSPKGLQFPSHSTESPLQINDNQHRPLQSQFLPSHNQYKDPKQSDSLFNPSHNKSLPGMFDERGSADGFQYPSHSVESPLQTKDNRHHPLQSQFLPSHNQYMDNTNIKPNSPFGSNQNKSLPGMFDERGSSDGFQYPSHNVENPLQTKDNRHHPLQSQFLPSHNQYKDTIHKQPDSLFTPNQNKSLPGIFDERGSSDGFQYPSHTVESPLQTKDNRHHPLQSQFLPSHNLYKDTTHKQPDSLFNPNQNKSLPGIFDERGSSDGFQYPSHTVESPLQTKDNRQHPLQSQFLPSHNQYKDTTNKQPGSPFGTTNKHPDNTADGKLSNSPVTFTHNQHSPGFYYPSHSADNLSHPNQKQPHNSPYGPTQNQYLPAPFEKLQSSIPEDPTLPNANIHNVPHPQLYSTQKPQNNSIHKQPEFPFGPTQIHDLPEVFEQVPQSTEDPTHSKNEPDTTAISKLTPKIYNDKADQPGQMSDLHPISPTSNNYNNNNPLRPWIHLDHDQYKPSSFDNLLNGVHNIPWSLPDDHKEISNIVSSTPQPKFESDRDQYKPSSLDNPLNVIHDISLPEDHEKVLNTITSAPKARFKPEHDQYKPWSLDNSLSGIHQIPWPIPNPDSDVLVTNAEITTPRYANSDSTQFNSHPETKPDSDPDKVHSIDDDEIPDNYDQLYPLLDVVKKLSEFPFDESALTADQLDLLPDLLPKITKILNYDPENDHDNALPVENNDIQGIFPWSKIKSKFKQLPVSGNGMLNWLKSKLNKLVPTKHNFTAISNDIDMTKIFNLLTKLTGPKINDNDFQEDTLTTTSLPRTDATHSYDNRIKIVPKELEENRTQASQVKYPDVHIILHQPNDQDDLDLPPFIETDGVANLANSEELGTLFSKTFNPRFKHRPKDQKDECGDGTHWISNCHGCSCYFGQPMCFKMPDCKLRSFGEPMPCKPYSHFKMGCYTCECNGDGVAECDAKDCDPKLSGESIVSETTVTQPLEFNEFFDSKKTDEILQYYNTYKKLPKYCPKAQHPTCEPGTSWISSCHKCECNESGKHECIKIDSCKLDFDSYGKPRRCKPNSKFYPKTNSVPCVECSCDDEGKSYCPAAE